MFVNNPRMTAVQCLVRIEQQGAYSNLLLKDALKPFDGHPSDKALVTALVYGVLDRMVTIDYYLKKSASTPPKKMDPFTRNALRCGVYQLVYMDKIPTAVAVHETVETVNHSKEAHNAGFCNAVLHRLAHELPALPTDDSLHGLSVRYSCPALLVESFVRDYGLPAVKSILEAFLSPAPVFIHSQFRRIDDADFLQRSSRDGLMVKVLERPHSFQLVTGYLPPTSVYRDGLCYTQDLSAHAAVCDLHLREGEQVLDVCAAPGGKSFAAALSVGPTGRVVSNDLYESRVGLIRQGADRLGLSWLETTVSDASVHHDFGLFDAVICDVPCSGFGVLRRKPEIKYKPLDAIDALPDLQLRLLKEAATHVRPGGRLLYATCTLHRAENEEVVRLFLHDTTDFSCLSQVTDLPHIHGGDGFYHAVLERSR